MERHPYWYLIPNTCYYYHRYQKMGDSPDRIECYAIYNPESEEEEDCDFLGYNYELALYFYWYRDLIRYDYVGRFCNLGEAAATSKVLMGALREYNRAYAQGGKEDALRLLLNKWTML